MLTMNVDKTKTRVREKQYEIRFLRHVSKYENIASFSLKLWERARFGVSSEIYRDQGYIQADKIYMYQRKQKRTRSGLKKRNEE